MSIRRRGFPACSGVVPALAFLLLAVPARAAEIRVAPGGLASGACGADWSQPCDLQYALGTLAVSGDELWVRAGTYGPGSERTATFALRSGVGLYGGFAGTEVARSERDPMANHSVLSGEVGDAGDTADNAFHVVTAAGVDATAVLDGFTVTGGAASGDGIAGCGGGILVLGGSPSFFGCGAIDNAARSGGAVCIVDADPSFVACDFSDNRADADGGGMYNDGASPILEDCSFIGNVAGGAGGGIYNSDASPTLDSCLFMTNTAPTGGGVGNGFASRPVFRFTSFKENVATVAGGGMSNEHGSVPRLEFCQFSWNAAAMGGAVFGAGESALVAEYSEFSGNSAAAGGALWSEAGALAIARCTFAFNAAKGGDGGAIASIAGTAEITGCTFNDNTAEGPSAGRGGAIHSSGGATTLANSTFSGNEAREGGALEVAGGGAASITNCTFAGNRAPIGGGALRVGGGVEVRNAILWGNTPDQVAAAGGTSPLIATCVVEGGCPSGSSCTAVTAADPQLSGFGDFGGRAWLHALLPGSSAIDAGDDALCAAAPVGGDSQNGLARPQGLHCDIGAFEAEPGNRYGVLLVATDGAAEVGCGADWSTACDLRFALDTAAGTELWVRAGIYRPGNERSDSFRIHNVAIYGGFAGTETMRSERDAAANPTVLSGDIGAAGVATDNVYHVVVANSDCRLDGLTVTGGQADGLAGDRRDIGGGLLYGSGLTAVNCVFHGNSASYAGGGLFLSSGSPRFIGCTFTANAVPAGDGGGVAVWGGTPVFTDCTFEDNTAFAGAGLACRGQAPTLEGCVFNANHADNGGGIFVTDGSAPIIKDCVFSANVASSQGGAIYAYTSSPRITGSSFLGNRAVYFRGGGMLNHDSNPVIDACTFSGNAAGTDGGGMANRFSSSPMVTGSTFSGNGAGGSGGGLSSESGAPVLANCTFSGNGAAAGGAVASEGGTIALTHCTLAENTATSGGGVSVAGAAVIRNGILWGNQPDQVALPGGGSAVVATSLLQGGCPAGVSCTGLVGGHPLLSPLGPYGGSTPTRLPEPGSPALDAADDAFCLGEPADGASQNGLPRPQGARCDLGAVELGWLKVLSSGAEDGWVLESGETSGAGGSLNAAASTLRLGDDARDRQYRAILSFDTSVLADDARILAAALALRSAGSAGENPGGTHGKLRFDIRRGAFSDDPALEPADFSAPATLAAAGVLPARPRSGWYRAPLGAAARAAIDPLGPTQLRLRFAKGDDDDHGADYLKLASGEAAAGARPALELWYHLP